MVYWMMKGINHTWRNHPKKLSVFNQINKKNDN